MRFAAVLNGDGGTLRSLDLDALSARMRETLGPAGHTLDIEITGGDTVAEALDRAAARADIDVVLAGGGDGTISAAAARLMDTDKALAVLPAGTMNLFARSLGVPLTLDAAMQAFASGRIERVNIASANGAPFIHQFSIGMHARMVQLREKMEFGSRLGKLRASARSAWMTLKNPRAMEVTLTLGEAELSTLATGVGITNNLFGEGHLPYADDPAGGTLGIYVTVARQRSELLRFAFDLARGKWRDSPHVEVHEAARATLKIGGRRRWPAVADGELVRLEQHTAFEIRPAALKVLVPEAGEEAG
ncbi:diacylglycerol/lipid kinase family protein [Mesorhizobium sp. PUT5]|uniref:diacylglycerol/lipid kinase family protein n=1 Tax=Mesorhizobium sp. PUT5 TaxID=3454629 RepID=UPI003FA4592C